MRPLILQDPDFQLGGLSGAPARAFGRDRAEYRIAQLCAFEPLLAT